jgi:hypothetical protein
MQNDQDTELLFKEYQATQDMIRHYDDITMRFATMSQAGVLIFVGLAFGLLSKDRPTFIYLFPCVILFVIIANIVVQMMFNRHRAISQIKIHRMLEIEKRLGFQQFSLVDDAIRMKKIVSIPIRNMVLFYHFALPVILVIAYIVIFFCRCC